MLSALGVAIRTVFKRIAADWLIVAAAFTTVMLASVLLASGPIYADAVTISALNRTLADAPAAESNIEVSIRVFPEFYDDVDRVTRQVVSSAIAATGGDIRAHTEADSYEIDGEIGEITALASVQSFEGLEAQTTLIEGSWPGQEPAAAVNAAAARALEIEVGDVLDLTNRRDERLTVSVRVSGIFQPDDPADPFWLEDPLIATGLIESGSFVTYGPFVVDPAVMADTFTPLRANASWRVFPHFEELTVSEVDDYRSRVSSLETRLDEALSAAIDPVAGGAQAGYEVNTALPGLLAEMDRSLTVTRSSVLALLIQLALLAGYALVLTSGLLVDTRRTETGLARSRGASPAQILGISLLEGLALTVPVIFAAPVLATYLLRTLNTVGPLATIGLTLDPQTNAESYVLASIAAALSIVALAWPAYRSARSFGTPARRHGRQQSRSAVSRLGADFALLALALIVFWQLQTLGPEISARVRGQFGVDPLLIVAPALALLAGGVLALRLIPLFARIAEQVAKSSRATVGALASWQVARRPARYARSALLLILAIGIGFFAASYATTWTGSQRDQARHEVGADVTVVPSRATGASLPDLTLVSAHQSVDGVALSAPVWRTTGQLATGSGLSQFVALDADKADDIVLIRDDLAPDFDELMEILSAGRPEIAGITLPGEPSSLSIQFDATELIPEEAPQCSFPPTDEPETCFDALVFVVLQDGDGVLHRLRGDTIPENEGPLVMEIPLAQLQADDPSAHPVYPLRLVNIEVQSALPARPREVSLTVGPLTVVGGDGSSTALPTAYDWSTWTVEQTGVVGADQRPSIRPGAVGEDRISVGIETGSGFGVAPAYFSVRPAGTSLPETFPVVVTEGFLESNFVAVGGEVGLPPLRIERDTAVIAGTVASFPTTNERLGEAVILDFPTLQIVGYEPGPAFKTAEEYWLSTSGEDTPVVTELRSPPLNSFRVESTTELIDSLVSDPVALGTIGALTVGFVAAAVFAAVGFAVSATVSARERLIEFALLRAVGLSPRQLGTWLALEQGVLVAASLGLGTLLGVVLTAAILPLITLTQDGGPANPEVIVIYPWGAVAGLELTVVGVLAAIVVAMTVLLRRVGLGSLLRLGED